ncbi:MAG: GTPase HflX [Rhodospirillaceae bacterium]|nr:GTPase HflX [Rhodospirillaceae bacterium]
MIEYSANSGGTTVSDNGATGGGDKCLVVHPFIKSASSVGGAFARTPEAMLDEITGLALAIDLDVAHGEIVSISELKSNSYFGKGTIERLGAIIRGRDIAVALIDTQLSPIQQRNLERDWDCKVLDRTGIILEIFGERARTKEGRMQVDLAHLTYQRSRLVRSWTHLERQRGGAGFMGGPGETQIETDRRLIDQRITKLKKSLKEVKRTRELHRKSRRKVPYPIIALVGYTNAGKSTIFNKLTNSQVLAKDQLFATLDPTMRQIELPSGRIAILSDTVGFISDLPHELVESFHATLEEVLEANIIVHVRDISHPDNAAQKADVISVLHELGLNDEVLEENMIEALNKIDMLDKAELEVIENQAARSKTPILLMSAISGAGIDGFMAQIDEHLSRSMATIEVSLDPGDGKLLSWLYDHGEVVSREQGENIVNLKVRLSDENLMRFNQMNKT